MVSGVLLRIHVAMMEIEGGRKGRRKGRRGRVASHLTGMHLLTESFQPFPSHLQNDSVSQRLFKNKSRWPMKDSFIASAL